MSKNSMANILLNDEDPTEVLKAEQEEMKAKFGKQKHSYIYKQSIIKRVSEVYSNTRFKKDGGFCVREKSYKTRYLSNHYSDDTGKHTSDFGKSGNHGNGWTVACK